MWAVGMHAMMRACVEMLGLVYFLIRPNGKATEDKEAVGLPIDRVGNPGRVPHGALEWRRGYE